MSQQQSTFFALHPRLQHGIAHTLGWSALRPVQELTMEVVLEGENCVVLAPTAGGKTEAAFFPILDYIVRQKLEPVCTLYISPIRALLNNQELRLQQLSNLIGGTAFKWHGDVPSTLRRRFLTDPSHILMTTPESLEVMLISPRVDKEKIFRGLRFVVIDEIHNFAADDRGAHLMAVLERLASYSQFDIQRIGLSATVGNPETIGAWMQGSSQRVTTVVDPPKNPVSRLIRIDTYHDEGELARIVTPVAKGRKTLFFVEGRRLAEGTKQALSGATTLSYVHHSAVGRELREEAEAAFMYSRNSQCIVCTSTMELGIDVGDLDAVLQLDSPTTVSSFMQRLGRTGRRSGSQAEMNFFCADDMALLRAIALVNLARRGWIESVHPVQKAFHILIHQILAQALQFAGVRRETIWNQMQSSYPFRDITRTEFERLVNHLLRQDVLAEVNGLLIIGETGEKQFSRQNFLDLYSVFETPAEIRVISTERREIGTLQTWFVQQLGKEFVFVLAGRAWQVQHVDLERAELVVKPAPKGAVPRWGGGGPLLSREVAEEIRQVLQSDTDYQFVTKAAKQRLSSLRAQWSHIWTDTNFPPLNTKGHNWALHTFAGDRINFLLSRALELTLGANVIGDSFTVTIQTPKSVTIEPSHVIQALHSMHEPNFFNIRRLRKLLEHVKRERLSKFQPLLPTDMELTFLAERLFDVTGLQLLLATWFFDSRK